MLDISRIANMAKVLLPSNSPWIEKIDQAAQMAQQFSPSKDGIAQLMAQHGKNKRDLQQAISMLNSPIIQDTLGKIPGLSNTIQQAANEISNDPNLGNTASHQIASQQTQQTNSATSLFERLKKLK